MYWGLLIILGPLAIGLGLQLLLLRLTVRRFRPLRLVALLLLLIPVTLAVLCALDGGWFWEVGVVLFLGMALFYLIGWGLACGVFKLWECKNRPAQENQNL